MDPMMVVVLMAGAVGIALLLTSVPPLASRGLARRVEPYLHGLAGKPSRLLVRPTVARAPWLARWFARFGLLGRHELRDRLDAAGHVPDELGFRIEQVAWSGTAIATTLMLTVLGTASGVVSPSAALIAVISISGVAGFLGRDWYLSKEIARHQGAVMNELPTAIDHMTLALLAGESVPGAFLRVASSVPHPTAGEFSRVAADVRAGAGIVEALEAFGRRLPDPGIARFVDSLCTAVERGTSLADVLRAQADDFRDARRRRLLEVGGRREILMLIPVVFLIMPVVVLFALYPGLVSLDLLVP